MSAYGAALKGGLKLLGRGVGHTASFASAGGKMGTRVPISVNPLDKANFAQSMTITLPSLAYGMPFAYDHGIRKPLQIAGRKFQGGGNEAAMNSITQHRKSVEAAKDAQLQQALKARQQEEMQALTQQKAAAMAATAPHLYNQIMAGRKLPQGATVLGGSPRTDLMEEIAYMMAKNGQQSGRMGGSSGRPPTSPPPPSMGGSSDDFLQGLMP